MNQKASKAPVEIERKWLIDKAKIPYDLSTYEHHELSQRYLSFHPTIRIRSVDEKEFILTVKGSSVNGSLAHEEYDLAISADEYGSLIPKCEGNEVTKTRYLIPEGDLLLEIDLFHGALEGHATLEIEFPDEESANSFPSPAWITRDVSTDPAYKNTSLARKGLPQ